MRKKKTLEKQTQEAAYVPCMPRMPVGEGQELLGAAHVRSCKLQTANGFARERLG